MNIPVNWILEKKDRFETFRTAQELFIKRACEIVLKRNRKKNTKKVVPTNVFSKKAGKFKENGNF